MFVLTSSWRDFTQFFDALIPPRNLPWIHGFLYVSCMFIPLNQSAFRCFPDWFWNLEDQRRKEGVLASTGLIYCIPEAAPTILRPAFQITGSQRISWLHDIWCMCIINMQLFWPTKIYSMHAYVFFLKYIYIYNYIHMHIWFYMCTAIPIHFWCSIHMSQCVYIYIWYIDICIFPTAVTVGFQSLGLGEMRCF